MNTTRYLSWRVSKFGSLLLLALGLAVPVAATAAANGSQDDQTSAALSSFGVSAGHANAAESETGRTNDPSAARRTLATYLMDKPPMDITGQVLAKAANGVLSVRVSAQNGLLASGPLPLLNCKYAQSNISRICVLSGYPKRDELNAGDAVSAPIYLLSHQDSGRECLLKGLYLAPEGFQLRKEQRPFTASGEITYKGGGILVLAQARYKCIPDSRGVCVQKIDLHGFDYYLLAGHPKYEQLRPGDRVNVVVRQVGNATVGANVWRRCVYSSEPNHAVSRAAAKPKPAPPSQKSKGGAG